MKHILFQFLLGLFFVNMLCCSFAYSKENQFPVPNAPSKVVTAITNASISDKKKLVIIQLASKYEMHFNALQNKIMANYLVGAFLKKEVKLEDQKIMLNFANSCNILLDANLLKNKISQIMKLKQETRIDFLRVVYLGGGYTNKFCDALIKEAVNPQLDLNRKFFIIGLSQVDTYSQEEIKVAIRKNNGYFSYSFFANYIDKNEEKDFTFYKKCAKLLFDSDELLIYATSTKIKKIFDFNSFLAELELIDLKLLTSIATKRLKLFSESNDLEAQASYLMQLFSTQGRLCEMDYIDPASFNLFESFLKSKSKKNSFSTIKTLNAYFDFLKIKHPSSSDSLKVWTEFIGNKKITREIKTQRGE